MIVKKAGYFLGKLAAANLDELARLTTKKDKQS